MNRKEAIKAMLDGKKVKEKGKKMRGIYCFYDDEDEWHPFLCHYSNGKVSPVYGFWDVKEWEIYIEPKPDSEIIEILRSNLQNLCTEKISGCIDCGIINECDPV